MSGRRAKSIRRTATHRPATRIRRNRHDEYTAVDLFSGFGGLTEGIVRAGFTAITAANHNEYKVEVHEANHPEVEHWIADLVDTESSDYHDVRELPAADALVAGVSCKNHTVANSQRAYAEGLSLLDLLEMEDPEYQAAVTRSERDRATANCVLHYAAQHHPLVMLIECTTEITSWGNAIPGKPKVGDGTAFKWWWGAIEDLGYKGKQLYLNSRFFDVDQSRDRWYGVFWDKRIPAPDLDHRPHSWCGHCQTVVEAVWTWRTGIPATGQVRYGVQYNYRCPSCRHEVIPPSGYSLRSLDLTDLGTRIGDKPLKKFKDPVTGETVMLPLAPATMARADRCRRKFPDFPAVLMPAKATWGTERHPWQPMATQTSQQETAVLSTGALMAAAGNTYEKPGGTYSRHQDLSRPLPAQTGTNGQALLTPPVALAIDNFQGAPRGADDPLATQAGSETMALLSAAVIANREHATPRGPGDPVHTITAGAGSGGIGVLSSGVIPYRRNTVPTTHAEAMPTVTSDQIPGLLTAAGFIKNNGDISEAPYRAHPVSNPLGTVTSESGQSLLFSGWFKNNGSTGTETIPHAGSDPLGSFVGKNNTSLLHAEWVEALADLELEDCYFRMMREHEIGRGCGFDVDFVDYCGTFKVWGSASDQVDGFGNAVSPQVGYWIGGRLLRSLHGQVAA